jgi:hypothetical protein
MPRMESFLYLLVAILALAIFWQSTMAAREAANVAAVDACAERGAQLLDGTVAFRQMRLQRGRDGRMGLRRTYVFDYSEDGETRRQGFVIVSGRRVEFVGLGPTLVN